MRSIYKGVSDVLEISPRNDGRWPRAVVIQRIRARRHQNSLHVGLEAPGNPRLVLLGDRRRAISPPRSSTSRSTRAKGSAASVTRVMSGAYDAGFGDANAVIQNAATKPDQAPVMVYMFYSTRAVRDADQGVKPDPFVSRIWPARRSARPAGGASLKMLPLMAKKNDVDFSKLDITQLAPSLQEQMLLQGQVDAIAIFTATSYMNLVAMKLDPDKDFRWLYYADFGADLYSNVIMVSQKLAKDKPEAVKGLVRAINRSIKEMMADPDAAIEVLAKQEPLINKDIEKRRLIYVYKTLIDTPEARELGIGDVSEARMSAAAATIAESFELPVVPKFTDVFNRVLPAAEGRADAAGSGQLTNIAGPAIVGSRARTLPGDDDA